MRKRCYTILSKLDLNIRFSSIQFPFIIILYSFRKKEHLICKVSCINYSKLTTGFKQCNTYNINLSIRMAHIANNTTVLHFVHMFSCDNVLVSSCSDHNINISNDFIQFYNSKAVHAERVNKSKFKQETK